MRLRSLTHILDVARAIARPERIVVIGSASLLPAHPELGEPGDFLDTSYDSDLLVSPIDDEMAAILAEAVGERSLFARREGYYADIMRPTIVEALPAGWESRLIPVNEMADVFTLNPYDLALVKLIVGRDKDLALIRELIVRQIVDREKLAEHYRATALDEHSALKAGRISQLFDAMKKFVVRPKPC